MKKQVYALLMITIFTCITGFGVYAEDQCLVDDPTDSSLNVRTEPWGEIIGTLNDTDPVDIIEVKKDSAGMYWAKVKGNFKGKYQEIGWVYKNYLDCGEYEELEDNVECVSDIKAPEIRETPDGKILGTLEPNQEVSVISSKTDSNGQEWVQIGYEKNDTIQNIGWVKKSGLICP